MLLKRVLPVLLMVALAGATFVEKQYGTDFAHRTFYSAWWFIALWAVVMGMVGWGVVRFVRSRRYVLAALHASFLLVFAGAMFTHFTSYSGMLHLRLNELTVAAPHADFSLMLTDFRVETYPGTQTPSDYVSTVVVSSDSSTHVISMNKILRHASYRFYQTSYDPDMQGTVLSVSSDPFGIFFTYLGYLLFFVSGIVLLVKNARIARMGMPVVLVLFGLFHTPDASAKTAIIPASEADSLAVRPIVYNGRVAPFNTMARDVVVKLYGKPTYKGLSAEQVIASFVLFPQDWQHERIIKIKSATLRDSLGLSEPFAAISDLYDSTGVYRLQQWYRVGQNDAFQKAIMQTDEKLALLTMLSDGTLFQPLPSSHAQHKNLARKLKVEVMYNSIPLPSILFKVNITLGLIAFLLFFLRPSETLHRVLRALNVVTCVLLTAYLVVRAYISGHFPLSNGYETMLFISWLLTLMASLFSGKTRVLAPAGLLLSGFTLLTANISGMNPQITSLMPVLASPWMTIHVATVMIAYALFLLATLLSVLTLLLHFAGKDRQARMDYDTTNGRVLLVAEFFLGVGIALGSVWANVSWGSYWSWDPKEVWALITFIAFGMVLHGKKREQGNASRKSLLPHVWVLVAFLLLLMTYFGVNVLFSGLHSYA